MRILRLLGYKEKPKAQPVSDPEVLSLRTQNAGLLEELEHRQEELVTLRKIIATQEKKIKGKAKHEKRTRQKKNKKKH